MFHWDNAHTLKVFPTYEAGIHVDVWQGDGAELLKVEIQHTPEGQTQQKYGMS